MTRARNDAAASSEPGLLGRLAGRGLATEATYRQSYGRRDRSVDYQREVLAFVLGTEEYGLDILRIREILKLRPLTEVPRAPAFVLGIISVRGEIMPVIDLRTRLRISATAPTKESRVLVVTRGEEHVGLIVDAVHDVVRLRDEDVEAPPPGVGGSDTEFISGIGRPRGERMLILLALDAVLAFRAGVAGGR